MTEWFPSEEWLDEYRRNLNANERYDEASSGWGVEFDGDFLFHIRNLPLEETTVGELPDELTDEFVTDLEATDDEAFDRLRATTTDTFETRFDERGDDREAFVETVMATPLADVPDEMWSELRKYLPPDLGNLLGQLEEYVHDDSEVYVYLELEDGKCKDTELLVERDARDPGFTLAARYSKWKELVEGADVVQAVLSRDMKLDGSVTTVLEYDEAAAEMGDTAGETPAMYLF